MAVILIAVGANLPDAHGRPPLETCRAAAVELGRLPGLTLQAVSRWFETPADPPSAQPHYVNGVARLSGDPAPERLLQWLHALEAQAGRSRGMRNAARPLDLDIIAMGRLVRTGPDPVLPHPRAHLRSFVLVPLADVAPEWVHPVLGLSVGAMTAAMTPTPIRELRSPG